MMCTICDTQMSYSNRQGLVVKKYAAVAVIAVLATSGCAAGYSAAKTPAAPADSRSTYVAKPDAEMMLNAIHKGWVGDDQPDAEWLSTASLLVCKQIIGGIEPRVTADPDNNELVIRIVEWGVCDIDR